MSKVGFWNARASVTLTIVVAWVALVLGVAAVPLMIPILNRFRFPGTVFDDSFVRLTTGPAYVCLLSGVAAVVIVLLLLRDIRRGEVFTSANVARLRLISYCGFLISAACFVAAVLTPPRLVFIGVGLVAAFLGLLMRVIKNVIDAARLLKEDADYTI